MDISSLRDICLSFPKVTESIKWENHLCFCIESKMFIILGMDESPVSASFKVSDENFDLLSGREGMRPAPYLARYKWISVDDISRMGHQEWTLFAREAYQLIAAKLPKKKSSVNARITKRSAAKKAKTKTSAKSKVVRKTSRKMKAGKKKSK